MILLTTIALADPTASPPLECAGCAAEAPPVDLGTAEPAPELDKKALRWFKPTRGVLPSVPRGQTDYTAYTLEWGEVEAGFTYISVGLLPGFQVSTVPAFYLPPAISSGDAVPLSPIWNVQAKLDVLRLGPVDIAPTASYATLDWPELDARFLSAGGTISVIIAKPWSIHAGATYTSLGVQGTITTDWLLGVVGGVAGSEVQPDTAGDGLGVGATLDAWTIKLATDVRLNRRDSIVLQAQSLVWTDAKVSTTIEEGDTSTELLSDELSGFVDPTEVYLATLSYQATFRNVDLRIGVGVPFDNPAWALQAFELAYRFGGPTRTKERKMLKGYRANRKADDAVSEDGTGEVEAAPEGSSFKAH